INLISFRVIGNDMTVTMAAHSGQLQLNAYEPIEALAVLESQQLMMRGALTLRLKCLRGVTVDEKQLAQDIENTVGIVTALVPVVGYDRATELAAEAYKSGKGLIAVIREKHALTDAQIKELLDPAKLTNLQKKNYGK
ncbi:MAG TPA: aspartate ammonia-lyase, partial [Polyangia bacterium]|nr:aspartate ammonia-lyase [Polyangia bacterium]